MKKVLIVCIAIVILFSMTVSAFATGAFVSSPSANRAPALVGCENESEDCVSELIVTAYGDRDDLSAEARKGIEAAYAAIRGAKNLGELNPELIAIAQALGISIDDLAVSDLFDISETECEGHEDHGRFDITLKPESLKNFVCLLHYYNGEWTIVENAEVTHNGEHLEFEEKEFSPFAIVVNTADPSGDVDDGNDDQNTGLGSILGKGSIVAIIVFVLIAVAAVIVVVSVSKRKKKA